MKKNDISPDREKELRIREAIETFRTEAEKEFTTGLQALEAERAEGLRRIDEMTERTRSEARKEFNSIEGRVAKEEARLRVLLAAKKSDLRARVDIERTAEMLVAGAWETFLGVRRGEGP